MLSTASGRQERDWAMRPGLSRGIPAAVMVIGPLRMNRNGRWFLGCLVALGVAASARGARAEASSWLSLAGGAGRTTQSGADPSYPGLMQIELGLGSSPAKAFVFGGVVKTISYFGSGTDMVFTLRGATGGFARGDFGFAIDAGGYQRSWGEDSAGFLGALVLGGPLGLQLTGTTEMGTHDARSFIATVGIDLLRLTVYRQSRGGYWPNPFVIPSQASR